MGDVKTPSNFNQAVWLAVGQFSTAALAYVSAAILSRYLDKWDYGTYKQVLYVYTTLSTLFIVGLPSVFGYFIPRLNVKEQKQLIKSINRLFIISGALFSLLLFFCASLIADLLKNPSLEVALKIFAPFPMFTLPALGIEGIYTALKKTKYIAIYSCVNKVISLICIVTPVLVFNAGYIGAILGWGLANLLIFIIAMYMKNRPYFGVKPELIPNMYKTIFSYCAPLVGAFVAGFFISSASQFFISRYYGTDAFADFSNGSMSIPFVAMIASSVKSVLVPVISKAHNDHDYGKISQVYSNATVNSIQLIFPMLVFVMAFARAIMVLIYGSMYNTSAIYFQMYTIRDFCAALPYFSVLMAFGKTKIYMYMHIFGAIFVWGMDAICVLLFTASPAFVVFNDSVFHVITSVVIFYFIFQKYHIRLFTAELARNILKVLLDCTMCITIAKCVTSFLPTSDNTITSLYALCIGGLVYVIALLMTGRLFGINYLVVISKFKQ